MIGLQLRGFATKSLKLTNIRQVVGFKRDDTFFKQDNCEMIIRDGKIEKIAPHFPEIETD